MTSQDRQIAAPKGFFNPEIAINLLGVLILSGLFLFWDFSRALYIITALFGLGYLIRYRPQLARDHLLFSLPIFALIGIYLLSLVYHGLPDRGMNMLTSRYFLLLLAIPLVSLLFALFSSQRYFWHMFLLPNLILGVLGLVDIFILGISRAEAADNAVVFGFVAVAITCIVIASYQVLRHQPYGRWLFYGALGMGLVAILFSGSRGSWMAILVVLFMALVFFLDRYPLGKRLLLALLAVCCLAMLSLSIPQVKKRVDIMVDSITPYVKGEQQSRFTSLSYRIESWKAAWEIGIESPLLGVGPGHFRKSLKSYVGRHPELEGLQLMKHAHNQYMQTFATSGFIGLIALLALLGSHACLFARYLRANYPEQVRSLAFAGLLLVVAYSIMSITAVPFERKKLILLYGFCSASLWACLMANLRQWRQRIG